MRSAPRLCSQTGQAIDALVPLFFNFSDFLYSLSQESSRWYILVAVTAINGMPILSSERAPHIDKTATV
jgi:hypothetical protein